jgi:mono/diheme cytochrome c family protein
MFPPILLFSMMLFMGPVPRQQAAVAPVAATIPPEAMHMVNPVKPTAVGLAHAKKMYGYDCEMCHGANGNGQGELAVQLKMNLKDWSDPAALQSRTDGELFYIIKNGQGQMPSEGDRAKPDDLWTMVVMVRAFAKK